MIKSARVFNPARHARDGRVRDAVRDRDAGAINEAVLTIVADGLERMAQLRKGEIAPAAEKELDMAAEVVDWGTRTFTSYVGAFGSLFRLCIRKAHETGRCVQDGSTSI